MISFLEPAWWALSIPLLWFLWRHPAGRTHSTVLRSLAGLVFIAALARPYLELADPGRNVILLVDKSLSMPVGSESAALEAVRLIESQRKDGDRLGVISFGTRPKIERLPSETLRLSALAAAVDPGGTDLAAAIAAGLEAIPEGTQGSLLIFSDGERTGRDPLPEARRAASRGLRIDVLPQTTATTSDLSVERFELPSEVDVGEPFQFDAWVFADVATEREVILRRDGRILSRGPHALERGMNRLVFRDIARRGGVSSYSLEVVPLPGDSPDRRPENDRGLGAVSAVAAPAVLLLNEDGATDTLAKILTAAGIPVDTVSPTDFALTRLSLTPYRAVILEDVAAGRLGYTGMLALEDFVTERGGGLWMTGGRASFGIGGYHLSPLDVLLPVSMEMRQESRKMGVAIAMVLDRSGSMSAPVAGGQTKMDLANAGAASAIEMLSPMDSVAVIAVDSSPHEVVSLRPVEDALEIGSRVRKIQSQGGGIYTYTGLLAAGKALEDAPQQNRHIILFADAADAEEPEGVPELLERFETLGITVSVIALGTDTDSDAKFLFETAEAGGGDIYFTTEPAELPRLFAQDTLTMARSTFIEEPTGTRGLSGLFTMGEFGVSNTSESGIVQFPDIAGYNLTYVRPEAALGGVTRDENTAPFFATAQRGVGRVAALTTQLGGTYGQGLLAWPELSAFVVSTMRFLLGQSAPEDLFGTLELVGNEAVVRVEVDRESPTGAPDTSRLDLHITMGDGTKREVPLAAVSEGLFEARVQLGSTGVALGSLHLADDRVLALPPIALPYSPEFQRVADPGAGAAELKSLALATGGGVLANLSQAFEGPRAARRWRVITAELVLAGLLLLLLEITVRRLALFDSAVFRWPAQALAGLGALPARLAAWRLQRQQLTSPARTKSAAPRPTRDIEEAPLGSPEGASRPKSLPKDGPVSLSEALERARTRADKRLDR